MGDQRFDGVDVELFGGRFKGAFDVPEAQGADMAYDEVYSFVVTARVGDVDFRENKTGDLRRINVLELQEVVVLTPQLHSLVSSALTSGGSSVPAVPASTGRHHTPNGKAPLDGQMTTDDYDEDGEVAEVGGSEATLQVKSTSVVEPGADAGEVEHLGQIQRGGDEALERFLDVDA